MMKSKPYGHRARRRDIRMLLLVARMSVLGAMALADRAIIDL